MSFHHKNFWVQRDAGCLTDGEINYDASPRIEPKRSHQWTMDISESERFSNKKQAIEVDNMPGFEVPHVNVSPWQNTSVFQSAHGQFSNRLFGSEPERTVNMVDVNFPSAGSRKINMSQKDFREQHVNNLTVGLSMSPTTEDPSGFSSGGVRKVRVNQVRDSSDDISSRMHNSYSRENTSAMEMGALYTRNESSSVSLAPSYSNSDDHSITVGPTYSKAGANFFSVDDTFVKGGEGLISMSQNYNKGNENVLSMGPPFHKVDGNFISIGQSFEKGEANLIPMTPSYNKGQENFFLMSPAYNKVGENLISMSSSLNKGENGIISLGPSYGNITTTGPTQDKEDLNVLSMGHNYDKGEGSTISFGVFHDESITNPSGSIISSYDLLMSSQNSVQASEESGHKEVAAETTTNSGVNPKTYTIPKSKEAKAAKKVPVNTFPSNVKSLLSTGILDDVPVKYVSWSREKSVKGIIKGTGYLCGCTDCNFLKSLNAFEFERHAICKTKHPNNHIYFESGKTIYGVVQELKTTSQETLFDVIQSVTGSPINQKNFRSWKASYQAATRELQRIYGKDEVVIPS